MSDIEISSPSTQLYLSKVKSRIMRSVLGVGVDADKDIVKSGIRSVRRGAENVESIIIGFH